MGDDSWESGVWLWRMWKMWREGATRKGVPKSNYVLKGLADENMMTIWARRCVSIDRYRTVSCQALSSDFEIGRVTQLQERTMIRMIKANRRCGWILDTQRDSYRSDSRHL